MSEQNVTDEEILITLSAIEIWASLEASDRPKGWVSSAIRAGIEEIRGLRGEIESVRLAHNARVSELLAANNAEVEKRRATERWAAFGRAVMAQHKDGDCGDVDGGWLQETGVQTGVLQIIEVKEPCAEEGCACAATCGDWPVDCYRVVTP